MKLLLPFLFVTTCSFLRAQVTLPYQTGFDDAAQQTGWVQHRKGVDSQFQEWIYENAQAYTAPNSLVHYYQVGGAEVMDDWFVSPAFSIPSGGTLDSLRYSFSGFGVPQNDDTIFIYLLNGSNDPDLATSVTILYEFSGVNYQNDNVWRVLDPIELPAQAGNSYIAFRHRSINNWLDVRFDNLSVSGNSSASLDETPETNYRVSPNPFNGTLTVAPAQASLLNELQTLELYDLSGKLISTISLTNQQTVEINLISGIYMYRLRNLQGEQVGSGKLIRE